MSGTLAGPEDAGPDERPEQPTSASAGWFAGTRAGRTILSIGLVVVLASVLVWNLPQDLAVRERLAPIVQPVVNPLGLNQRWELFSPDPSRTSVEVTAEVAYADGSVRTYRFPDGEPFFGALREYRWRKLERRVRLDSRRDLWGRTAAWIAGRYEDDAAERGTVVASVTLVRRTAATPPPGSDADREWQREEYFTLRIPGVGS
jgi:hypothetical protein